MPTAKLVAFDAHVSPHEIPLVGLPLHMGRSEQANICVEDRWVSRNHCVIEWNSESLIVRDLHSRHGTYVNGQPVACAPLHAGDELIVGLSKFVVRMEESPAELAESYV